MSGFHVHIALTALAVAGSSALECGGDDNHCRRMPQPLLPVGGSGQLQVYAGRGYKLQTMLVRLIAIRLPRPDLLR